MNIELLNKIDPDHFTLDEVMAIWGIRWRWVARMIMNTGIRRREFSLKEGYYKLEK